MLKKVILELRADLRVYYALRWVVIAEWYLLVSFVSCLMSIIFSLTQGYSLSDAFKDTETITIVTTVGAWALILHEPITLFFRHCRKWNLNLILRYILNRNDYDIVKGDLSEQYDLDAEEFGEEHAKRLYIKGVLFYVICKIGDKLHLIFSYVKKLT